MIELFHLWLLLVLLHLKHFKFRDENRILVTITPPQKTDSCLWPFGALPFTPTFPYSFYHSHLYKHQTLFCGNLVLLFSQKCLLELNLTHSLFFAWSFSCSWVNRSSWHVSIRRVLFCMQNNPPSLQRPFFRTLMWFPADLQKVASLTPECWSLSCFTALS